TVENRYVKLNVEGYGGMIASTWMDRPLTVAGRVIVRRGNGFATRLVNIDEDMLLIPNVAIHMNREINDGYTFNIQNDLLPLYSGIEGKDSFMKRVAENAGVRPEEILGHDLYLTTREKPVIWGPDGEFFSSPRIDDLECAFAGTRGFIQGEKAEHICVLAIFDNEEVGSGTRQGAASTFLKDTLSRLMQALGKSEDDMRRYVSGSFLASADNGHAVHPNHPEKTDPTNRPYLNGGVLLKYAASQSYTTDGLSAAVFKDLCRKADVPYQTFFNRSDMRGGSTLGNISIRQVPVNSADIGLAQLSMHSAYETAGVKDYGYLERFAEKLFS
ncbi:MAG: M18 family aminopeptidase, partial [Lachnospiraceae bacterium]|nr:M18 family aminopeptidase [Lachnospiraceae bacterium]